MHPQMQELFIKKITEAINELLKGKAKNINSQLLITTHSPHILNSKIHHGCSLNNIVQSLRYILSKYASRLETHNQLIRCITYTNIAAREIKERLGNTELVKVSTIHDFLWEQINLYQEELVDIHKQELQEEIDKKEQELENKDWARFYQGIADKDTFKILVYENEENYYKNKHKGSADFKNTMNSFDRKYLSNVNNFKKVVDCILDIHKFSNFHP